MMVHEQRTAPRVTTNLLVTMRTPVGHEVLRVTNLSFGGMQVDKGKSLLGYRDKMDLKFRLPRGVGSVICKAEVVYSVGGLLGIRFTGLTTVYANMLGKYLTDSLGDNWFN